MVGCRGRAGGWGWVDGNRFEGGGAVGRDSCGGKGVGASRDGGQDYMDRDGGGTGGDGSTATPAGL